MTARLAGLLLSLPKHESMMRITTTRDLLLPAQLRLWDIEQRRVTARLAGHGGWVWCLEAHPTQPDALVTLPPSSFLHLTLCPAFAIIRAGSCAVCNVQWCDLVLLLFAESSSMFPEAELAALWLHSSITH